MDAAQALAELTEISAQIEAAVLAGADGSVLASTFKESGRAEEVARISLELLVAADEARAGDEREPLVQLQAATPEGSVFVVHDERRVVAAVTRADPTVGLVFYDLKTCLRFLEEDEQPAAAAKAGARGRRKNEEPEEKEEAGGGG
jgi:predicted regulator of Ras-like GTPase activity (Roadblock/LC7/MglB family)